MLVTIKVRADTSANWASDNPVLIEGEFGFDTDLDQLKVGDGLTPWNDLEFATVSPAMMEQLVELIEEAADLDDGRMTNVLTDDTSDFNAEFADQLTNSTGVIGEAARSRFPRKGNSVDPLDFDGDTEADALQACLDHVLAQSRYPEIRFPQDVDVTGAGWPYQTVATYGNGGSGLTSFTLTFDGQTTSSISASASAATVQSALEALSNITPGEVAVTREGTGTGTTPYVYTVQFKLDLAHTPILLTATPTGGTGTVTVKPAAIGATKNVWYNRNPLIFRGAGGALIKEDEGALLTAIETNTGDFRMRGMMFRSIAGAGAALFDGDKLIRINSTDCDYQNWDHLLEQTTTSRVMQSVRSNSDRIVGGDGAFIRCRESYDCTFENFLCEDRDEKDEQAMFFENIEDLAAIANRNLRILNGMIENCDRVPIKMAFSWGAHLLNLYMEQNGNSADPYIDLSTLCQNGRQTGVTVERATIAQKQSQVDALTASLIAGKVSTSTNRDAIESIQNVQERGILWEMGHANALVDGTRDFVENNGYRVRPEHEAQYRYARTQSLATTDRPRNVYVGQTIFDTTLAKPITATAAGTFAHASVRFTGGASSSGNLTFNLAGWTAPDAFVVPVAAGDTLTQVRDKVVAAASTFFPLWRPVASSTDVVAFEALSAGQKAGATTFNAGATGVTSDYAGLDVNGTGATWIVEATTAEVTAGDATTLASALDGPLGFVYTVDPGIIRSSDNLGVAANQGVFVRVLHGATITKIGFEVATQAGNMSLAVYSTSGTGRDAVPDTRKGTTGSFAVPAPGYAEQALGSAVDVNPGDWLFLSCSDATARFRSMLGSVATDDLGKGRQRVMGSAHPAPATASGTAATIGNTLVLVGVP